MFIHLSRFRNLGEIYFVSRFKGGHYRKAFTAASEGRRYLVVL